MRNIARMLAGAFLAITAMSATASSLTISPRHDILITDDAKQQQLRVLFADEPLCSRMWC
jgi:hypothetical protein